MLFPQVWATLLIMKGKVINITELLDNRKDRTSYRANKINQMGTDSQPKTHYVKLSDECQPSGPGFDFLRKTLGILGACISDFQKTEEIPMFIPGLDAWKTTPDPVDPRAAKDHPESLGFQRFGCVNKRPVYIDPLAILQIEDAVTRAGFEIDPSGEDPDSLDWIDCWMRDACTEHGELDLDFDCYLVRLDDLSLVLDRFDEIRREG